MAEAARAKSISPEIVLGLLGITAAGIAGYGHHPTLAALVAISLLMLAAYIAANLGWPTVRFLFLAVVLLVAGVVVYQAWPLLSTWFEATSSRVREVFGSEPRSWEERALAVRCEPEFAASSDWSTDERGKVNLWIEDVFFTRTRATVHVAVSSGGWNTFAALEKATGAYLIDQQGTRYDLLSDSTEYDQLSLEHELKPGETFRFYLVFPITQGTAYLVLHREQFPAITVHLPWDPSMTKKSKQRAGATAPIIRRSADVEPELGRAAGDIGLTSSAVATSDESARHDTLPTLAVPPPTLAVAPANPGANAQQPATVYIEHNSGGQGWEPFRGKRFQGRPSTNIPPRGAPLPRPRAVVATIPQFVGRPRDVVRIGPQVGYFRAPGCAQCLAARSQQAVPKAIYGRVVTPKQPMVQSLYNARPLVTSAGVRPALRAVPVYPPRWGNPFFSMRGSAARSGRR
jgi:hypothetical protein